MAVCKWCGNHFSKKNKPNATAYCCEDCREEARREQNRIHSNNYFKKYKNVRNMTLYGLGSYGAKLGSCPNEDFKKEFELIKKERKRLKIGKMF